MEHYDAIILGGGPAGLTAGIYLARARVKTLIVDSGTAGGQMILSHAVANYPGVEQTTGAQLAQTMLRQAESFGCRVLTQASIERLDLDGPTKTVVVEDEGTFSADAVIIATGGVPRTLGLESEARFKGMGISYCATCDGEFFTGMEIAAIGGGNSAIEEALSLAKYARKVTVIHEFDHFQAQPWLVEEARANPRIEFLMEQSVLRFEGENGLERVVSANKRTDAVTETPISGAFVFIGYLPNTDVYRGIVELNERGEIVTGDNLETSVPGVFAAGDARVKRYRQITTAVSDGTVAALALIEHLQARTEQRQAA
jgi:thioredoxin reductase (NADPH)